MLPVGTDNYSIRPFKAYKSHYYEYVYKGGNPVDAVFIDYAERPPVGWDDFIPQSETQNDSGIYTKPLHHSVELLFYTSGSSESSGSKWFDPNKFTRDYTPADTIYVINMIATSIGEGVDKNTFRLTATESTASIYDDGYGKLISSTDTTNVIGNIFYDLGIAVINNFTGSYSGSIVTDKGIWLNNGQQINVQFDSIHTIYEHRVVCPIAPSELNYSINPTVSSLVGNGTVMGTGPKAYDLMASGTLQPYWTTIGLYNDVGELVAIGKVPRPVKRITQTEQTIIVRFDM